MEAAWGRKISEDCSFFLIYCNLAMLALFQCWEAARTKASGVNIPYDLSPVLFADTSWNGRGRLSSIQY